MAGGEFDLPTDFPSNRLDPLTTMSPFNFVGGLEMTINSSRFFGSAVALSPNWVLTAGHNVDTNDDGQPDPGLTADDCSTLLGSAYRHSPCVSVLPVGTYPSTKWVRHTNRALYSVQVDNRTGQLIVMGAVDNLVKGQAGQGVQCLNLMAGLEATTGLPLLPFYP